MLNNRDEILSALERIEEGKIHDGDIIFLVDSFKDLYNQLAQIEEYRADTFWADKAISLVKALAEMSSLQQSDGIANTAVDNMVRFWAMDAGGLIAWDIDGQKIISLVTQGNIDWKGILPLEQDDTHFEKGMFERDLIQSPLIFSDVNDSDLTPQEVSFLHENSIKTLIILPMLVDNVVIGLIFIADKKEKRILTDQQIALGGLFANQAGILIERTRLYKETQKRALELQALHQVSLSLTASLDLQKVLDAILESTLSMLGDAQDAHIFLYDGEMLSFGAVLWNDGNKEKVWAQPRNEGLTYKVAREGNLIYVNNMKRHSLFKDVPSNWKGSIIGLPLKIGNRVVGVMTVAHSEPNAFADNEVRVLRLIGDQAAVAIENARLHNLVNKQAHTDMLTEMPNRRALEERLEDEIRRSRRYKHKFSILMLDLDRFKRVNDTYGHPVGDIVLKQIAKELTDTIRETDFLARYGGDEFTLLLPETDVTTAKLLSDRLKEAVVRYCKQSKLIGEIQLGLSVGVSTFPDHAETVSDLLASADRKLYEDKHHD